MTTTSSLRVIKRDGTEVEFDWHKIKDAIQRAANEVPPKIAPTEEDINHISMVVSAQCEALKRGINVEEVQEMVETALMKSEFYEVAKRYIRYRYERGQRRARNTIDDTVLSLVEYRNEAIKQENSNKDPEIIPTQRDYIAGEVSKDLTRRMFMPADIMSAHDEGIIHFHDADYFIQHSHNCDLINLEDMLQNGTVISGTMIERPHSFSTACNIATQIIAQVASCQYGGQTITLSHLAPFVDVSRRKIRNDVVKEMALIGQTLTDDQISTITEMRVLDEIRRGVQTIQYQVITLMTTNGQAPFITVFMNINEVPDGQTREDLVLIIKEALQQRIQGVKNEVGQWITPAFPKLIYCLDENNVYDGSRYYELTRLAAQCTAVRMVPDYISAKKMREYKVDANGNGNVYPSMGCRSFLTTFLDEHGSPKYYGRFNQGVVTINLVDVALSSGGDMDKFWDIFEERLELCHRALRLRHERLLGTPSDVAPILWQYGAIARLKKGETIDKLLFNGYSTISLGYAGLYECTKYMTGVSHTDNAGKPFALSVMQKMNDKTAQWKAVENIDYSLYGTPLESTTYKFAKSLQHRFGVIEDITDHNYITNSYHVNVREKIDAFQKLQFESEFQRLSPGGGLH